MSEITDEELLNAKLLLRPDEAARILRVKKGTIYYMIRDGSLEAVKFRHSLRIKTESIKALLENDPPI